MLCVICCDRDRFQWKKKTSWCVSSCLLRMYCSRRDSAVDRKKKRVDMGLNKHIWRANNNNIFLSSYFYSSQHTKKQNKTKHTYESLIKKKEEKEKKYLDNPSTKKWERKYWRIDFNHRQHHHHQVRSDLTKYLCLNIKYIFEDTLEYCTFTHTQIPSNSPSFSLS